MVKSEIRSTVLSELRKWDAVAKFHPRVLDAHIEYILHQMLGEVFRMNPLSLQRYTRGYGYTVPLTVLSEASSGIYYTTLPKNIYVFMDKAAGVRRVSTPVQGAIKFYPMDQREWDLVASGSLLSNVKNKIGYVVTPARVEYYNMLGSVITSGVKMDLLIPFSEFADTDIVPYPEHLTEDGKGFFDRIVERMINIPPVNLKDQNKDEEVK